MPPSGDAKGSIRERKEQTSSAAPLIPPRPTLRNLREAATGCKACDLWLRGTQTVFGEGTAHAKVMFVGEQPGDKEDLEGKPFVGPAGALLDKALVEAGIDRRQTYVTNAVKHFKWEPRGKRRIHKKPNSIEITACRAWLEAEIEAVQPEVIVCLGATAAQALLGRQFRVTQQRGQAMPFSEASRSWQRSILLPFCGRRTKRHGTARWASSLRTLGWCRVWLGREMLLDILSAP